MKVNIYRLLFFVLLGMMIGLGTGSYFTTKVLLNNLPPTTEVSIGKVKLRGRDNTANIEMTSENTDTESVEPKKKPRRRKRR